MGARKHSGGAITCDNCRKRTGKGLIGCHWICRDCQAGLAEENEESDRFCAADGSGL
ncbi:hypothetical protein [Gorillibacterium timonense]|uniref:hypothetical protein n=1 Tax=Gorillibacterium timonense TaxID=1689269 RepID=UPI00131D9840|nr:hypothetical protein [Gorillibacterium timonense]